MKLKKKRAQSVYQVFTVACNTQLNRFLEITWNSRKDLSAGNTGQPPVFHITK